MKNGARKVLLPIGDIFLLLVAFFAMLKVAFSYNLSEEIINTHLMPFAVISVVWVLVLFLFNLYDAQSIKPTIANLQKIGMAYAVALIASIILLYTIPYFGITPKTNLLIFGSIFILLFIVWRRIFYKIFSIYFRKSVAFIINKEQDSDSYSELSSYMENYPQSGFYIQGTYSSLKEFTEKENISGVDMLIVSKDKLVNSEETVKIYNEAKDIFDISYAYEEILGKIPVDSIDESWFLHNIRNINKTLYNVVSKIINNIVALVVLVLTSPFLILAAIFIKLEDGGSIFYTQKRVGKNGNIFNLYKLRSMVKNADQNGPEWTEENDHRITSTGKIIRKLHIDEIPQLINVLRGEMALVGPRPEIPSFAYKLEREINHYSLRHIITPGFTGWAQIKFQYARNVTESKEKFKFDLYYIKNRNIFMDIGIILRTIQIVFTHR